MKKILFPLLGTNKGGNILSTISICKKINKDNFKTSILLISPEKKNNLVYKTLKKENIKNVDYIHADLKKSIKFILLIKLAIFCYKKKFDIIHTNDGLLNFYFSILNLIFKFNLIIHLRNTDNSRRNYIPFLLAKKIICISHFVKNKTQRIFNSKKIVLYNYVEIFNKKVKLKRRHNILIKKNINKKVIIFVSNIHRRKKPDSFLEIMKKLVDKNKDYIGFMFFQSQKKEYLKLKKYIRKNKLEKSIFLLNNLPVHYWIPFVKKFRRKIMIATSRNEPLGRNLIESALNNIFVVANNSGGHKEIVSKNSGVLCDMNNINNVANIVNQLFKNIYNKSKKIDTNSIKKKFQSEKYFIKIEKIYANILF